MCCGRKALKLAVDFEHDTTLRVRARECARPPCTDHRAAFMCNPSFRLTALDELSRARFSDVVCWPFNGCYSPIVHATYEFYSQALVSVTPCQAGLRPRPHESCFTILKTSDSIAKPGRANTTSWCYDCCKAWKTSYIRLSVQLCLCLIGFHSQVFAFECSPPVWNVTCKSCRYTTHEPVAQSWHQHKQCLLHLTGRLEHWPTAAIKFCQSARKPLQHDLCVAGNRPAALCSAMVARCWLLQKSLMESCASRHVEHERFEAAETHSQHHLMSAKCDQVHTKSSSQKT